MKNVTNLIVIVAFLLSVSCAASAPEWVRDADSTINGFTVVAAGVAAEKFKGKPNEELMAEEGARSDARAKLVEAIVGAYINAGVNVENREAVEQGAKTEVSGMVRGMVIKKRFYDEGKRTYYVQAYIDQKNIQSIVDSLNKKLNLNINYEQLESVSKQ